MIGKPKYDYGQKVEFEIDGKKLQGVVYIIDKYGTFFDDSDVSYDIMVGDVMNDPDNACLYKHVREDFVTAVGDEKGV